MRRPRLSTKIYRTSVFPSTQASIRILVEPVLEGPMQVKFRVEVWRCHLSLELKAHCPRRSRQEIRVFQHTSATIAGAPNFCPNAPARDARTAPAACADTCRRSWRAADHDRRTVFAADAVPRNYLHRGYAETALCVPRSARMPLRSKAASRLILSVPFSSDFASKLLAIPCC